MITFLEIIQKLEKYWRQFGCKVVNPADMPVGAATMHPHFILNAHKNHKLAYMQPCRRPQDSRPNSTNRLYKHHQFQVTINPIPENIQDIYLDSLLKIGFDFDIHEIKFIAGNWQSPSLGAFGVGSEVWANNSEISQFTYFQQIGGTPLKSQVIELTYGLERIAMSLQNVDNWRDIIWQDGVKYEDIDDLEFSTASNLNYDITHLHQLFNLHLSESQNLINSNLQYPAYEEFLKASHAFNTLEARQAFSPTQRVDELNKLRNIGQQCVRMANSNENINLNSPNENISVNPKIDIKPTNASIESNNTNNEKSIK
ncbi:glycine--tRNA ligase subunit alpha [Candidatus Cytomitobacter primus]|uniref:Glycine--tRNA ligase alpha subunit n=1 Tax=Candidatus Cytomitobacter primus TaxID=2066024 RepID=A0A5C0UEE7_9PROT|nr:glycine--tRNA ligase subunit alpha [Candidatus Cytomitobacter primus]QEK38465.1 glycine--tRNA ligase subunit alpha [Candidatus Cytomitobacter primus]